MSVSTGQVRRFTCGSCRKSFDEWKARCPNCQAWMTRTAKSAPEPAQPRRQLAAPAATPTAEPESATAAEEAHGAPRPSAEVVMPPESTPVPITEVESVVDRRVVTGIEPLDRVLGGGFVPGHLIMVSGDPGTGKSTLLAQVTGAIQCERLLYATGEESIQAVADRARRVGCAHERIRVVRETVAEHVISHAEGMEAQVLVIDSMQTLASRAVSGPAGSVQQIEACTTALMALSQRTMMTTIAIVHMTKDGDYAGPKRLEHMFDVALHLSRESDDSEVRHLRCPGKNRGGSTMEVGSFLMTARGLEPLHPGEGADEGHDEMLPIAQELVYRLLEAGGTLDDGLRDRIAGRLDMTPRTK